MSITDYPHINRSSGGALESSQTEPERPEKNETERAHRMRELQIFEDTMTPEERLQFFTNAYPIELSPESIDRATARANDFWKQLKGHDLSKNRQTEQQAEEHLREGCCRGATHTLLDYGATGLSMKDAIFSMDGSKDDILFRQLVSEIDILDRRHSRLERQLNVCKDSGGREQLLRKLEDKLSRTKEVISQLNSQGIHPLYRNSTLREAVRCTAFASLEGYAEALNKVTGSASAETTVQGIILIPKHIMGFELGPKGYYLFDTYLREQKGLYSFPDKETFMKATRAFVHTVLEEDIETESLETLKEFQTVFMVTSRITPQVTV